ncbi:sucrase ferredoxin, partial [Actinomadura adrarensis]
LRGRAGLPEPAQAAEHFVRDHSQILDIDGVTVESLTGTAPYEAVVRAGRNRYRVIFESAERADRCGAECEENHRTYFVRDITLLNAAALV